MAYHADLLSPAAVMFAANGLIPNYQPSYHTNYDAQAQAQAQAPTHNGYPGYALPSPPSYGYYNPNHPSQGGPSLPAHSPYSYSAPPSSYNNGNYDRPVYQAPAKCPNSKLKKAPSKPKAGRTTRYNVIYEVIGNRVSGNTGDHDGVFNIGNKNSSRGVDDHNQEDE